MKIKDLTNGELLFVYRRRHPSTQAETAAYLEVSTNQYRAWETDEETAPRKIVRSIKHGEGKLAPHEIATLKRRRAGIRQPDLAAELGVSTNWLCRMERGDVNMNDDLINRWHLA